MFVFCWGTDFLGCLGVTACATLSWMLQKGYSEMCVNLLDQNQPGKSKVWSPDYELSSFPFGLGELICPYGLHNAVGQSECLTTFELLSDYLS